MTISTLLFDLDDTLYPFSSGMGDQVNLRITEYVHRVVGGSYEEARVLRYQYYHDYGTSLHGLMKLHNIDPDDYLAYVHPEEFDSLVQADPKLAQLLKSFSLNKHVFTNSPIEYARRILANIGIADQVGEIFDIRRCGLLPKPELQSYQLVLDTLQQPAESIVFFEDSAKNLLPAKQLGMTTVLISDEPSSPVADIVAPDIYAALEQLRPRIS
jgi:putative hydrolase of the HAD superfamily